MYWVDTGYVFALQWSPGSTFASSSRIGRLYLSGGGNCWCCHWASTWNDTPSFTFLVLARCCGFMLGPERSEASSQRKLREVETFWSFSWVTSWDLTHVFAIRAACFPSSSCPVPSAWPVTAGLSSRWPARGVFSHKQLSSSAGICSRPCLMVHSLRRKCWHLQSDAFKHPPTRPASRRHRLFVLQRGPMKISKSVYFLLAGAAAWWHHPFVLIAAMIYCVLMQGGSHRED